MTAQAVMESSVKYRPCWFGNLTLTRDPGKRQCLVGSLTGVVASQNVTEAFKGSLATHRNRRSERKSKRELNCETNKSSRWETRI